MTQTAIGAAMERAGLKPSEAQLNIALARWRNNGGTFERMMELARAAYELPGEASVEMPQGQKMFASARQPNGDEEGQMRAANQAVGRVLSSSPQSRDGAGQGADAEGQTFIARSAREPNALQRKVMGHVAKVIAKTQLASFRLRDGRMLVDVPLGQLRSVAAAVREDAMVLSLLAYELHRRHPNRMADRVGDVLKPQDFDLLLEQARERVDA